MSLELGLLLALGLMVCSAVSLYLARRSAPQPATRTGKVEQAAGFIMLGLSGASLAILALDTRSGWEVLRWTGYIALAYGLLGNVIGLGALYRFVGQSRTPALSPGSTRHFG